MDSGRKSSEFRRSFDAQDRRRSVELARSTRRYDEHWGAAERADTRLKCSDNVIHHVHSQVISCWSPVLRDMVNLVPTHGLLESTHGLAYVLQVQEDSVTWAAVLDMIYPVVSAIQDWELYERVLLLADKYNMTGVLQRCVQRLCEHDITFSLDAAAPNFVLRWMALSDKLQLHQLSSHLTSWVRPHLPTLACRPDSLSNIMAYARDNLGRDLLLQLLSLSLQVAAAQAAAAAAAAAGGSNGMNGSLNLVQGSNRGPSGSKSRSDGSRRQRRRTNDWVMGEEEQAAEQDLAHVLGFDMLPSVHDDSPSTSDQNQYNDGGYGDSATSSLGSPGGSSCGREGGGGGGGNRTQEMQQRLAMCMTSGLFVPAVCGPPAPPPPAAANVGAMGPPNVPAAAAVHMNVSAPPPSYAPIVSTAPNASFHTHQQQQQQQQPPSIPRMGALGFPLSIPPSRSRPAAPCLESVMEVDGGELQQQHQQQQFPGGSGGWAAKLLPGERRRSLAF